GEVADLTAQLCHLVVERADEARCRHALAGRDVVEDRPEHRFQADARAIAIETDRARDHAIAFRILIGKDPTHELSSLRPGDHCCPGTTPVCSVPSLGDVILDRIVSRSRTSAEIAAWNGLWGGRPLIEADEARAPCRRPCAGHRGRAPTASAPS